MLKIKQNFVSIPDLLDLVSKGEIHNAITNINLAFEALKLNQTEKAFNDFVDDIWEYLNERDKNVCGLVQIAMKNLKKDEILSMFAQNRFSKAVARVLVDHVTAGCPNGCGLHSDIHGLAVKTGIYQFYPSLIKK
jgi:hypothetical protein